MGQVGVDLPDPLESLPQGASASAAAAASATGRTATDELLAQLAGDEIDRLLAEADRGAPRAAMAPFHVGPSTKPEVEPEAEDAPAPFSPDAPAPAVVESKPSEVDMEVTAELDALFSAAVEKDNADAAAQMSAAERAGLKTVATMNHPAADTSADDVQLPRYLRPLEWLNAPLAIFPVTVRDLIGKAAIITLLNAAAIIAYVLIVRRG
jgi:hypothetical protein